jgi:hypothetical protein
MRLKNIVEEKCTGATRRKQRHMHPVPLARSHKNHRIEEDLEN